MRPLTAVPIALIAVLAACSGPRQVDVPERSNVLLITVDTLRRDSLGWIGGTNATPTIDRLADEGFAFATAVAAAPVTLPSHTAMLTGRYPLRHGVRDNGQVLAASIPTFPQTLQAAGYRTGAVISGYPLVRIFGLDRGFDHYDDELPGAEESSQERPADVTTAAALEWLRDQEGPWFLWVHYYDPHAPYDPPRVFWQPGERGRYDGEVTFVDHAIETLLAGIPADQRERLLTVFTADHGESFGEHDESDHGMFVYDTTITVPLVFHYPGVVASRRSDAAPPLVDLAPTILDLVGLPALEEIDGLSLEPAIAGGPRPDDEAYVEAQYPWTTFGWAPIRGLRTRDWKIIDAPRPELYDLRADPDELHDLSRERPDRFAELLARLDGYTGDAPATDAVTDPEVLERLRALGYVGGTPPATDIPEGLADPKDRTAARRLLMSGENLFQAGDYPRALAAFSEVLIDDPENRFALLRSGLAELRSGRAERAVTWLERAVAVDPQQPEARYALADALTRAERYDEAVPEWQQAIALQPRRVAAWANLGSTLGWLGRTEESILAFTEAAALGPDRSEVWENLSYVEFQAGRAGAAARHLQQAAELNPDGFAQNGKLAGYWLEAARQAIGRDEPNEARAALTEALRLDPGLRAEAQADAALRQVLTSLD